MMDLSTKQVLLIDLHKHTSELRNVPDLDKYIGGVAMGLKLLHEHYTADPLIFSIGPLNGFYPFCSKTSVVFDDRGVPEDIYLGGSLSTRIAFSGLDSIVILGKSEEPAVLDIHNSEVFFRTKDENSESLGLPGKRCTLSFAEDTLLLDNFFKGPDKYLEDKLRDKNVNGLVLTGSEVLKIDSFQEYKNLYKTILAKTNLITINKNKYPSCSNCPMGCEASQVGEMGGNIIVHSLVACQYAERIYSDVGVIYSCLNALGYKYKHEDIESLPKLVENTLKGLS